MLTAGYPLPGRMVPDRKRCYPNSNSGLLWRMSLCWNVFKAKAGRLCQDFCGTVALVMIDLERSSDSLGPSVDSLPRQAKPMRRTTFGESNAREVAVALCRAPRHRVPPLFSSCMQYRTFLISEYCSHESLICTVHVSSFFCTSN